MRMPVLLLGALTVLMTVGGCYRPRLRDCNVACDQDRQCATGMTCSNGFCTTGPACSPECKPAQRRCQDNGVQACTDQGTWGPPSGCGAQACFFGQCAACVPGTVACAGNGVLRCQSGVDRQPIVDMDTPVACTGAATCTDGTCVGASGVTSVAAGDGHTCVTGANTVRCWGQNSFGQLGQGDTIARGFSIDDMGANLRPVRLSSDPTLPVLGVSVGGNHTCALLGGGQIKCWGDNSVGQLGASDGEPRPRGVAPTDLGDALPFVDLGMGLTAKAVRAGQRHTCALLTSGHVKCWGDNQFGQLGSGHPDNIGDGPNELGDRLPSVDLGTGATVVAIAVGAFHCCALLDGGGVRCWGSDEVHQLGLGSRGDVGRKPNEMGDRLTAINLGTGARAVAIAAGAQHTCALLDSRAVKCWGSNSAGQLGIDDPDPGLGDRLPALPLTGLVPVTLSAGGIHTCLLSDSGGLLCWGGNLYGQLGRGDVSNRSASSLDFLTPVALGAAGGVPLNAISIAAGGYHTCALLASGDLKCWGLNRDGQLGLGLDPPSNLSDSAGEVGDNLPAVNLAP